MVIILITIFIYQTLELRNVRFTKIQGLWSSCNSYDLMLQLKKIKVL